MQSANHFSGKVKPGLLIVLLCIGLAVSIAVVLHVRAEGEPWTPAGLSGIAVESLAVSPNWSSDQTMLAGTVDTVHRTTNGGSNWSPAIVGSGNTFYALSFATDEFAFLGGNNQFWVSYSTDGGASWTAGSTTGISGDKNTWDFAVSPDFDGLADKTVFVAGNNGVHESSDGGANWVPRNNGLSGGSHFALAISPDFANDQTIFVGTVQTIYKTTNGGLNWTAIGTGIPGPVEVRDLEISPDFANDNTVFACVGAYGIYRSTDGGANWSRVHADSYSFSFQSLAISPDFAADRTLFAGTQYNGGSWTGVLASQDGGNTWIQLDNANLPLSALTSVPRVAVSPSFDSDRTIFIGTSFGVYKLAVPQELAYVAGRVESTATATAIPNADVEASSYNGPLTANATTDANGDYRISYLPPGCYRFQVFPDPVDNYRISSPRPLYLASDEGRENFDFDLEMDPAALSGTVYQTAIPISIPLSGALVNYENASLGIDLQTLTQVDGSYSFSNLPTGPAFLTVTPPGGNDHEGSGKEIDLAAGANTEGFSFTLDDGGCVTGRVLRPDGSGAAGIYVVAGSEQHGFDAWDLTDAAGAFSVCNMPAGRILVEVEPGIGNAYCETAEKVIYLGQGDTRDVGTLTLQACTVVQGQVTSPNPDNVCGQEIRTGGYGFEADGDTELGVYQMRLPAGTHTLYLEDQVDEGPYPYAAYPVQVTVSQADVDSQAAVIVPQAIQVLSAADTDAAEVTGTLAKSPGLPDPTGEQIVVLLPQGSRYADTAAEAAGIGLVQESATLPGFTSFAMSPVPPGNYDAAWILDNLTVEGVESITIRQWYGFSVPPGGGTVGIGTLTYAGAGSPQVDGYVHDVGGNPVAGARVVISDADGVLMGIAETDDYGHWVLYNLPAAADYTATASHPFYPPNPGQDSRTFNAVDEASITVASQGDPLVLNVTQDTPGSISGTVTDGITPLELITVAAIGVSSDSLEGLSQTGAGGTYTIANLPAGSYRVLALGGEGTNYFANQFYVGATNWQDALPVTVDPGVDTGGIDFALAAGGKISGVVELEGAATPAGIEVEAWDYITGKWVGRGETSAEDGLYTIGGLPAGSYRVQVAESGYLKEYYDGTSGASFHLDEAVAVTVANGATTGGVNFMLNPKFTLDGSIKYIRKSDGSYQTWVSVLIGNDFTGTLPGGVATITVRDPSGAVIADKLDFAFTSANPTWREFDAQIASPPALGLYTFTVTGINGDAAVATDYQYVLRTLPVFDNAGFSPPDGAVVDSKTPMFTWTPIEYSSTPDTPIFYRLEIYDNNGGSPGARVFASGFGHNKLYHTLPQNKLTPGGSYLYRVRATDGPDWISTQNRTDSGWIAFTVADPLAAHASKPVLDPKDWQAASWTTDNGTGFLGEVTVVDLDGIAGEGTSHTVTVTFPGDPTPRPMTFDGSNSPTSAVYSYYTGGTLVPGTYTFTVTDPEPGNTSTIADTPNLDPLAAPDRSAFTPSLSGESITAVFDNVYVDGSLYDDFDSYADIGELNPDKWQGWSNASLSNGAVLLQQSNAVGRADAVLSIKDPNRFDAVRADVAVASASSNSVPRARIAGSWFNNGNGDIYASISVFSDRVEYSISELYKGAQNTWRWNELPPDQAPGPILTGLALGQTVTIGIAWDGTTLTFSAGEATRTYTPGGAVYPSILPEKLLMVRLGMASDSTPTFTWASVPGAARYRVRIYNNDSSETIWRGYTQGIETAYTLPPGILQPDSYYRYRIDTYDARSPNNVDNAAKTPPSNNDNFIFFTDSTEPVDPYIDLDSNGVSVWNDEVDGARLQFWVEVHDAQGVPADINFVRVTHPDLTVEYLELLDPNPYRTYTPTFAVYYLQSDKAPVDGGTYTFRVEDNEENFYETSEVLTSPTPIAFAPQASLLPANGTQFPTIPDQITFEWQSVADAAFYQVDLFDYDFNRIEHFFSFTNQLSVPTGFFEPGRTYRWRMKARRELFENNVDNVSGSPARFWDAFTFTLGTPADTENSGAGDGIPDYWEELHGLDPTVDDSGLDPDGDGLTNLQEFQNATDPQNDDTDGDGYNDGREVAQGTDPNDGTDFSGIPDIEREALIALYSSTNGASWTNKDNWDETAGTECTWYGVSCSGGHVSSLNLTGNNLTGTLPAELGNLSDLETLNLNSNQLMGSIPAELGNLGGLKRLNLSSNRLVDYIPADLQNLTRLNAGESDLRWNALHVIDDGLRSILNAAQTGGDWESTQTVVPPNFAAGPPTTTEIPLSWDAIVYSADAGGYEIEYATDIGGPYTLFATTADKTVTSTTLNALAPDTTYYIRVRTRTDPHANNQNTVYSKYINPITASTAPLTGDSDGDGLLDNFETNTGTYVSPTDTGTDPNNWDSDGDGLSDGDEVNNHSTDPTKQDTDGDGFSDLHEVQGGTDPNSGGEYPIISALYVDAAGNDLNLGDSAHPLKTLHVAVARANASPEASISIRLMAAAIYSAASEGRDEPVMLNRDMTINGNGARIDGAGAANWVTGLALSPGAENVTIQDLIVQNFEEGLAIQSDGGCVALSNVTISACETGIELAEAYQLDLDLGDARISSCGIGIKITAGSADTTVRNGVVQNSSGDGIRIESSNQVPDGIRLEGITVNGSFGDGIALYDGSGHEIVECAVTDNNTGQDAHGGIAVLTPCATVYHNTIDGNLCLGLFADDMFAPQPLDATYNWWGDASGPAHASNPAGSGNAVSENVLFDPWLSVNPGDDSDLDGLPDSWETANFGDLDETGEGDFDKDGWPNLAELQASTDPADAAVHPNRVLFYVGGVNARDANLGDAAHPLRTVHGAARRINGLAEADYTIYLLAGTYDLAHEGTNQPISLNQNATINGAGAVLDGSGVDTSAADPWLAGLTIGVGADRVSLNGLKIRNFTQGLAIVSDGACIGLNNLLIEYCDTGLALVSSYQVDLDLADSEIRTCRESGILVAAGSSNNQIRNGSVQDNLGDGIRVEGSPDTPDENHLEAIGITGNIGNGIVIYDGIGNLILDCVVAGNNTGEDAYGGIAALSGGTTLSQCVIENNGCLGVFADDALSTEPLDALNNWWGDESGPTHPTNPSGSGDAVSDNVFFQPWLGYSDAGTLPADKDGDGLDDQWEEYYFGSTTVVDDADADADDDGITNLQEELFGTAPNDAANPDPVGVAISQPAKNPSSFGGSTTSVTLSGISYSASQIVVTNNGSSVATLDTGLDNWSTVVYLSAGNNDIVVTATQVNGPATAMDSLTVVVDNAAPSVSIELPTPADSYHTSLVTLSLGGFASDASGIASVAWSRTADGVIVTGTAAGKTSWTTTAIPLVVGADNFITVTATDALGNQGSDTVTVTREEDAVNESSEPPANVVEPEPDPLDLDGDGYQNADETACGSNPSDQNSVPANYAGSAYPTNPGDPHYDPIKVKDENGVIVGYRWPDCLNPDDDRDGMPDAWETKYGLNPLNPSDADDDADGDSFTNLEEFRNETDPTKAPQTDFTLEVLDVVTDAPVHGSWMPEYGKVLKIRATLTGTGPLANLQFVLKNTTSLPGRAVNDPDPTRMAVDNYPAGYDYHGFDFGLSTVGPTGGSVHSYDQGPVTVTGINGVYIVYLQCWDYGGRTRLVATTDSTDPAAPSAEVWIPKGSGSNGISSIWVHDGDPANRLDPNADPDAIIFENPAGRTNPPGDGLNNFEEYRGVVYTAGVGGSLQHLRLNPLRKDLFLRTSGFGGDHPYANGDAIEDAGIDVHDTTTWGHDATEDGRFFRYYRAGSVDSISGKTVNGTGTAWGTGWPQQEWEFRLDAHASDEGAWTPVTSWDSPTSLTLDRDYSSGTSGFYSLRMSMPHLNVLIVRLDNQKLGVFSTEDGRIIFLGASPPSVANPTGSRHWAWTTKGHARYSNLPASYGVAEALRIPLDHYFGDRPYIKASVWNASAGLWDDATADDKQLKPLSMCEDPADAMAPIDGFHDFGLGILVTNHPNGAFDGDLRLATYDEWDSYGIGSPFDIDGNGAVELPKATNPNAVDAANEYDMARVLRHSVTHEICHILAKTSWHSWDDTCVMYRYSTNWKRDGHLSDDYRELLRVHNLRR